MSTAERQRLVLGRADHGRALTEEQYATAEFEEPWRYELVEGELSVMSPNSEPHCKVLDPILEALYDYRTRQRGRIDLIRLEAWLRILPQQYRIGDLGVFLTGTRSGIRRPLRMPELLFEVVTPDPAGRRRDYVEKRGDYWVAGVLEYVILDPSEGKAVVLNHREGGYEERVLARADTYTSGLLPGLAVPLGEVLREPPADQADDELDPLAPER